MPALRFYVSDLACRQVRLDDEESRHARKVMRLAHGDAVELFDGAGTEARGTVIEAGRSVVIDVNDRRSTPPPQPSIDLAVAIPKGDRAAVLIEKASELGADRLIPLITQRSVVEPGEGKLDRLRRICIESAKQCGRVWLMQITEPISLDQLLREAGHDLKLIADRHSAPESWTPAPATSVLVLIGPEGGWTDDERRAAVDVGFHPWRLSPHTLRIETAALAALAILRRDA